MTIRGRPPRRDFAVLAMAWRELCHGLGGLPTGDLAWMFGGGGLLLAYAVGIAAVDLRAVAPVLRADDGLWNLGLPALGFVTAVGLGLGAGRGSRRLAHAPWTSALPLGARDRRRMAAIALGPLAAALPPAAATVAGASAALIGRPVAAVAGIVGLACALGFCAGAAAALASSARPDRSAHSGATGWWELPLDVLDRPGLAWLGSWAWRAEGGRIGPSWSLGVGCCAVAAATAVSVAASLVRHEAGPAAVAAVVVGLAAFMLSLRCRPLASPVLRTAPVGFFRAWLRLLRLPLLVSAAAFAPPAGVALAAEPSASAFAAHGALWLAGLNAAYAVFAASFPTSPRSASAAFAVAVGLTAYESLEYGSAVGAALVALLALMLRRARRRFRHG